VSGRAIHAERLASQGLSGPPMKDPVAVAERLLAIQGQDPRGARLAVRARTKGLTAADVDRALTEDRSLVIAWVNRGTLHLLRSEDYFWLHALTTPPLHTGNATRLRQEEVSPRQAERGIATIERALADEGPLSGAELRERLRAANVPAAGQAGAHIIGLAALRGLIVRGPVIGRQQAYALVRDWLGEPPPFEREAALAELARRYLAGHGPADDRDLAKWAGLPLRDSRAGLAAIGSKLEDVGEGRFRLRGRAPESRRMPPPRLLGAFEPVLLGWTSRGPIIDADHERRVADRGAFWPFALVGGRAVANWKLAEGEVELGCPFGPVPANAAAALRREAADVRRFLAA
jgi:hypothetical protein